MGIDFAVLQKVSLFKEVKEEEFEGLFNCIGGKSQTYDKGEFIFLNGYVTKVLGIVLSGRVQIIKEDVFGNRAILNDLGVGQVFGESFVCGGSYILTVSVQAVEKSDVLFLPFERVIHMCPNACSFHSLLMKNMLEMISRKNMKLIEKLEVTTKHSLREKVLTYLSQLAQEQGQTTVISSMGRVDLADFFGADRSALTRELNRMQQAGLITFKRNTYTLLNVDM